MSDLVQIAQFYDPEEAYCAKSYLQSHGIETFVQNDHHLTMAPWLRVALGGYRLLAIDTEAAEARKALSEVQSPQQEKTDSLTISDSEELKSAKRKNWIWLPIAYLHAVPFLPKAESSWWRLFQLFALTMLYASILYFSVFLMIRDYGFFQTIGWWLGFY